MYADSIQSLQEVTAEEASWQVISDADLKKAYNHLSDDVLEECRLGAEEKNIAINITDAIMKVLQQQTNGSISWERLASQVVGGNRRVQPVSAKTIAKFVKVKATSGFHYFVARVLPQV